MAVSPHSRHFCSHIFTPEILNYYRYKEETDQSYFEGTGYASVTTGERVAQQVRYEQTIETTADEGIVFFASNGVMCGMLLSVLQWKNILKILFIKEHVRYSNNYGNVLKVLFSSVWKINRFCCMFTVIWFSLRQLCKKQGVGLVGPCQLEIFNDFTMVDKYSLCQG